MFDRSQAWMLSMLAVFALSLAAGDAGAEDAAAAPDFALKATDGHNYRLSEYRGEVVAVLFWASWCGGCRRELERLQSLSKVYGETGLRVLAVTMDERPELAQSVAASAGVAYPLLLDATKSVSRAYRLKELPTIALVDRSGALRFAHGEIDARGERELLAELRTLLDE
jgi:peroxiredoxin